jgi:hypothetical protein
MATGSEASPKSDLKGSVLDDFLCLASTMSERVHLICEEVCQMDFEQLLY